MKNIHRQLLESIQSGERIVLATVVKTSGSTPQKPGIHGAVLEEMEQSLSGPAEEAICTLESKDPGEGLSIERYWIKQEKNLNNEA
ncbi:MAG: XdhC family protein [Bacteroidetes bacterium]|nr:XdhC family protein [Bacteroidota bacterium]